MSKISLPLIDRLWKSVNKNGPAPGSCPELGPCWIWGLEIDVKGFGIIYDYNPRRRIAVHHLVYEETHGTTLSPRTVVDQLCGNGACCNPAHLKVYTWQERFWAMVDKKGPVPETRPELGPCWPFTGHVGPDGYGSFRATRPNMEKPHRISYEIAHGPIPDDKEIDHVCHDPKVCRLGKGCPHRRCVNPDHLEAVTAKENCSPERSNTGIFAKERAATITHCPQGHKYTPENTYTHGNKRGCLTCRRGRNEKFAGELNPKTAEGWALRTHCKHGHELTEENTYVNNGCKICRRCTSEAQMRYHKRKAP